MGLLFLANSSGTVTFEVDPEVAGEIKVEVIQDGGEIRVIDARSRSTTKLSSGAYGLAIHGDQDKYQRDRDRVTVTRGGQPIVKVTPKWRLAFNKWFMPTPPDMRGWDAGSDCRVACLNDGVLRLDGDSVATCRIEAKDMSIRVQVRKLAGDAVELRLRSSADGRVFVNGSFDGSNNLRIGKTEAGDAKAANLALAKAKKPLNDNFSMEFRAEGDKLSLLVDGQPVLKARDPSPKSGMPAIETRHASGEFSQIELMVPNKEALVADRRAETPAVLPPMSPAALVDMPAGIPGLRSWSVETVGHRGGIVSAALSPDGKLLATGGDDPGVRLWDPATGKLRRLLLGHSETVRAVAWSRDGKTLASGGKDGSLPPMGPG